MGARWPHSTAFFHSLLADHEAESAWAQKTYRRIEILSSNPIVSAAEINADPP
jgi:hypothetical protein